MKQMKKGLLLFLSFCLLVSLFSACRKTPETDVLWEDAEYTQDTELGTGRLTVRVEVRAGDKSVTFTVHTDRENLGDALMEYGLIAGTKESYGLYVKVVNGITADYDVDQSYWGFYRDGKMMTTGVDGAIISDGEHYELVYSK